MFGRKSRKATAPVVTATADDFRPHVVMARTHRLNSWHDDFHFADRAAAERFAAEYRVSNPTGSATVIRAS